MNAISRTRLFLVATLLAPMPSALFAADRLITADVVALDQAFYNNRLGAFQPGGMIFALRRDVVSNSDPTDHQHLKKGEVMLRPDKRPRPMVLRMNVGDCLQVNFQNLLADVPSLGVQNPLPFTPQGLITKPDPDPNNTLKPGVPVISQSATRVAGVHVMGMEAGDNIGDDASWVGRNPNGLAAPGESKTYKFCSVKEGAFLLYSTAADVGNPNVFGGQLTQGLFGSVLVQPRNAEWYRSQVTRANLDQATYNGGQLPAGMTLTPLGQTFSSGGKTYKLWKLQKTGPGAFTATVTQTNLAGDPVDQNGLLKTQDLQPIINYQATYSDGKPVLAMLDSSRNMVYSDLTAIVTGPNAGDFSAADNDPVFNANPTYPKRRQPYREFAIHYHDDPAAQQAFPVFGPLPDAATPECLAAKTCGVMFALQAARDFFAINYGMAAIGPEVWANRIQVGPMSQCATCKFEEFFLSSWAVADPAMIVDFPANSGHKATKALFPDDPSNVYHSYMGDHVEFRILHAGTNITHVHHQHAHQWLHSPDSDESDYRDSQMLSPGGAYTLDMSYFGSGNLNQTVGDSIFHCHFYPHFAQGMWSLWRVHDVFEAGTKLDNDGIPTADWNRALPDGEITSGTPIPGLVPLPTIAMAPMPIRTRICPVFGAADYVQYSGDACPPAPPTGNPVGYRGLVSKTDMNDSQLKEHNPGFPFFVPGVAGQRPPHPPLDFAPEEDSSGTQGVKNGQKQYLDGGLPRSQFLKEQGTAYEKHTGWDFTKDNDKLLAVEVAEEGTEVEKVAMATHAVRTHKSAKPNGQAADFILNGQPPKPGAPFADPAIDINGIPIPDSDCQAKQPGCRRYKAADIELDVVLNKKGWHYPQQRILALWGDVKDNLNGTGKNRPEPLFFRANSGQVVEYWLTNLVPNYYELDDFQVRTPTDIIGQHIHLVKFDVTSSDGAGNGFNYEDGTFSFEEVQGLIKNVNDAGGLVGTDGVQRKTLTAKEIPFFKSALPGKFLGAQATIQRWYADPMKDNAQKDRTLRTVFTHDHFGPSTHQQVGLYAGLVVEPKDSKWFDSTTGDPLGGRDDGGPTTFQANINVKTPSESYREFLLEFQDRQLAYTNKNIPQKTPYVRYTANPTSPWGWADHNNAINPPNGPQALIPQATTPDLVTNQISEGAFSLNYSNEPLPFRIASGTAEETDLAHVFRSIPRADAALNCQPKQNIPITAMTGCGGPTTTVGFRFPAPPAGAADTDPYTPLLRAYEGENIQIRNLVGAHMAPHSFHIHGLRWLFEPSLDSSGFRSTQGMGISEHYEFLTKLPVTKNAGSVDYLYAPTSDTVGIQYGNWGLIRGFKQSAPQSNLHPLSETQEKAFPGTKIPPPGPAAPICPSPMEAPPRSYKVAAVLASDVLPRPLEYNPRGGLNTPGVHTIPDNFAIVYVNKDDLQNVGGKWQLKAGLRTEPLILRAAAGECISVELENLLPGPATTLNPGVPAQAPFSAVTLNTSHEVGLHPQLLSYDITDSDGFNIGCNPPVTVAPNAKHTYTWYAGKIDTPSGAPAKYTPIEFGTVNLAPADPIMQDNFGLLGALIIEPRNSKWKTDQGTRAAATVTAGAKSFREGVIIVQDDLAAVQEPAINYRTEPFSYRYLDADHYLDNDAALSPLGVSRSQSNTLVAADPETPVFPAAAGKPLRLRVLHPAGLFEQVFELHGHAWQEEPYSKGSTSMVDNNPLSQWTGSRDTFGANSSFDVVLQQAGGRFSVQGDYLFRTFVGSGPDAGFLNGMWGIVRVGDPDKDVVTVTEYCAPPSPGVTKFTVAGRNTVSLKNQLFADHVTITGAGFSGHTASVNAVTGSWSFTDASITTAPANITVTSSEGGTTIAQISCPIQAPPPGAPALITSLSTRARKVVERKKPTQDIDRFRVRPPALKQQ